MQGLETAWRAVSWRYVDLPPDASPPEINEPIPSLEILLWWDTQDEDGWDLQHPEQIKFARQQYKAWGMRWAVMHCTLCPLEYMSDLKHMGNDGDPAATWMTFIRVFNKLMAERIVLKTKMHPHRAARRSAQRLGLTETEGRDRLRAAPGEAPGLRVGGRARGTSSTATASWWPGTGASSGTRA